MIEGVLVGLLFGGMVVIATAVTVKLNPPIERSGFSGRG